MRLTSLLISAALMAGFTAPVFAADAQKILNFARVTDKHKILKKLEGKWTGRGTFIATAGGAAEKIICKSTNKLILGGRFIEQSNKCKGASAGFAGFGYFGYDILSGNYVGATMTEADTGISNLRGNRSGDTITFNIVHNNVDLRKRVTSRAVLKISDKKHTYKILTKGKNGEFKPLFSITYTR